MNKITNFSQVEETLRTYVRPTNEPGGYKLDRMHQLMAFLGNPQDTYQVVHVAGTSGKTSTTYYVAAMLQSAGYKVGHTVSPHVDSVRERAQVNLQPLVEADYCEQLNRFLEIIAPSGVEPSYFELLVAFAYWLFAQRHVDYAVIEVGLGGLLDGTNVITRPDKVCVITDIGFDHMHILGNTIAEIATQKAGIIHADNTVFMHEQSSEIVAVIKHRCSSVGASLNILPVDAAPMAHELPLFQQRNYQLAVATTNFVLQRGGASVLSLEQLQTALGIYIPARMEVVRYGNKTVIVDGSHNEQKIAALVDSVKAKYLNQQLAVLVSFGDNKAASIQNSLGILKNVGSTIILTEFSNGQDVVRTAIPVAALHQHAKAAGFTNIIERVEPEQALALLLAQPEDVLLVTGSFYLLNHVRPTILET